MIGGSTSWAHCTDFSNFFALKYNLIASPRKLVFFFLLTAVIIEYGCHQKFFLIILTVDGMNLCPAHDSYGVFYMIAM